jgi:integrase
MDNLKKQIRDNRPKISDSSVRTYGSILSNLYKKISKKDNLDAVKDFFVEKVNDTLDFLKDVPSNKRKTILAALVVLTEHHEKAADRYRKQMLDDKGKYDDEQKDQKMSDSQRENWVSQDEVKKLYDQMDKENRPLLSREKLNDREFQHLQNFLILALYVLQAPRRLKDYTEMKLRNVDENKDNFIKANNLVFNIYKTSRTHGRETVVMNPKLKFIINKWKNLNPNEHLLVGLTGKKLSSSQLQQRLNQILGKKASVNILRHSFLSEKYKDLPALKEMEERAADMGHTLEQALLYVKKDSGTSPASKEPEPPVEKEVKVKQARKKKAT